MKVPMRLIGLAVVLAVVFIAIVCRILPPPLVADAQEPRVARIGIIAHGFPAMAAAYVEIFRQRCASSAMADHVIE
mgnify:CR=1 FL=1